MAGLGPERSNIILSRLSAIILASDSSDTRGIFCVLWEFVFWLQPLGPRLPEYIRLRTDPRIFIQ